jgi:hypothetical protein
MLRLHPRRGRARFGLLLVALVALGATIFLLEQRAEETATSAPRVQSPDQPIAGFRGTRALESGELVLELFPLHPDAERQAFDAQALRESLGLEQGEPWALRLFDPRRAAGASIGILWVSDGDGTALERLVPSGEADSPLAKLLAAPQTYLGQGVTQFVLWGRAPRGAVRLHGLDPGSEGSALLPVQKARKDLEWPLARLDSRDGKSPETRSSAGDPGTQPDQSNRAPRRA